MRCLILIVILFATIVACAKEKSSDKSIVDYGADPSGVQDSTSAIQQAIYDAQTVGVNVYVPPGTYLHNNVITLTGTQFYGEGQSSVLYATDDQLRAVQLMGNNPVLRDIWISGESQARLTAGWNNMVYVNGAKNFVIQYITLRPQTNYYAYTGSDGNPAVFGVGGIITDSNSANGLIQYNEVGWTWADGIHTTGISTNITIQYNVVHDTGDDCIPVIGYTPDHPTDIFIYRNTIYNNHWARGLVTEGGIRIRFIENTLTNVDFAAFWVGAEDYWQTMTSQDVIFARNIVYNASNFGQNCATDSAHYSSMGVSNTNPSTGMHNNIIFVDNQIYGTCDDQFRTEGDPNGEIILAGNYLQGAIYSTTSNLYSTTASVYSVNNFLSGGQINGYYASGTQNAFYSLNDIVQDISGPSRRAFYFEDNNCQFNHLQIQNAGIGQNNQYSFTPYIGINRVVDSLYVSNVYNDPSDHNQLPANFGSVPPKAKNVVVNVKSLSSPVVIPASTFLKNTTANRLLVAWGGVGGVVDMSYSHDDVTFTFEDFSKFSFTFSFAISNNVTNSGVAAATATIDLTSCPGHSTMSQDVAYTSTESPVLVATNCAYNLVISSVNGTYQIFNRAGKVIYTSENWASGPGPYSFYAQDDGNLCMVTSTGAPIWASNTGRSYGYTGPGPFKAQLGTDGILRMLDSTTGDVLWSS